jgi:hypothetical protein
MRPRALPRPLHVANEALAFLLELVMLAGLGAWGAQVGRAMVTKVLLGAGVPLTVAVLWSLFASPKARMRLPMPGLLAFKALAFAAGTAAICALGRHGLASVFAVVALLNTATAAVDRGAAMRAPT